MIGSQLKTIGKQVYLLNVPLSLSTAKPNNATMRKLSPEARQIDMPRALDQWQQLYSFLATHGIVYLLPSRTGLQDLTYVANLGVVLHHRTNQVVISNFRSPPRVGETEVGCEFFRSMGFEVAIAPPFFEGEADMKYLRDNIYFGGHGMRTSREAHDWLRDTFDMQIISIRTHDEHLYHLDCVIFPLTDTRVICCTQAISPDELKQIEGVAEVVAVDYQVAVRGLTNSARCGRYLLSDSILKDLDASHPLYQVERRKVETLARICDANGLELVIVSLSEFYKSGAALSCMVMHLNHLR